MESSQIRFETLIEQFHDEIYRYLWRLLNNAGWPDPAVEAEDLTQEVFLRAYRSFGRLRQDSNHRAWLYKIATNCTYTTLKKSQRQANQRTSLHTDVQIPAGEQQSPEHWTRLRETLSVVQQTIASLPPKQRIAVILRHVQGLDYATIAAALDCSEDSARANVYQGLRRLRRKLVEETK
jgi:RNA polymerase sigma-70 factor (ECF subfamily)